MATMFTVKVFGTVRPDGAVRVVDPDGSIRSMLVGFHYQGQIELPFAPFPGLSLVIPANEEIYFVESVQWDVVRSQFDVESSPMALAIDTSDLPWAYQFLKSWADNLVRVGWKVDRRNLCEGRWADLPPAPNKTPPASE